MRRRRDGQGTGRLGLGPSRMSHRGAVRGVCELLVVGFFLFTGVVGGWLLWLLWLRLRLLCVSSSLPFVYGA